MTQQITIPLALLEQIVGALDEVDQHVDLKRYDTAPNEVLFDVVMAALTAGHAALEGAQRVRGKPAAYIVHKAMCEPYMSYRKVKDALRNEPLYKDPPQ